MSNVKTKAELVAAIEVLNPTRKTKGLKHEALQLLLQGELEKVRSEAHWESIDKLLGDEGAVLNDRPDRATEVALSLQQNAAWSIATNMDALAHCVGIIERIRRLADRYEAAKKAVGVVMGDGTTFTEADVEHVLQRLLMVIDSTRVPGLARVEVRHLVDALDGHGYMVEIKRREPKS